MEKQFQEGDIIQMKGKSVPPDLWDKWFRVVRVDEGGLVVLSQPYLDAAATEPYHPAYPAKSVTRSPTVPS